MEPPAEVPPEEPSEPARDVDVQMPLFMEGVSRLDRVFDDSGFAYTALDIVVRIRWRSS